MAIHSGGCIYVASDSAITGSPELAVKIAAVSSNCCVAIAGVAETRIINSVTKQQFPIRLFDALTNICDQTPKTVPRGVLVSNIVKAFSAPYGWFLDSYSQYSLYGQSNTFFHPHGNTCLLFAGFDEVGKAFATQYVFNPANRMPEAVPVFGDDPNSIATPLAIYGDPSFADTVVFSPEKFAGLHAEKALENVREIYAGKALSDEQVIYTILELFQLVQTGSFDNGKVGPPFLIYKLTKASMTKLR